MRRKERNDDEGSMDSLLDTLTNVVGILVIVLVVTQLGVGDAVSRITESIKVDPEEFEAKKSKLITLNQTRTRLKSEVTQLKDDVNQDEASVSLELEQLKKKHSQELLDLANLKKKNLSVETAIEQAESEKEKREEVEAKIKSSLREVASLKSKLDQTPEREVLPGREMRLPDPRPAPPGLIPFRFICYNNRIYPFNDFKALQKIANERAKLLKSRSRNDPMKGIDPDRFIKDFSRAPIRNKNVELAVTKHPDGRPRISFTPLERGGASVRDIDRKGTRFNKDLAALDSSRYYLEFWVCGDSYDVYMSARAKAEALDLAVGWLPQPAGWKYASVLQGIRLGPPPKPVVASKTPPVVTPAKPSPPKKPANVID
jgi:hypothetical protein